LEGKLQRALTPDNLHEQLTQLLHIAPEEREKHAEA
jgi:hypothetical protein